MKNIRLNSKFVQSGDIFIAYSCEDSLSHILEAKANGATLIFSKDDYGLDFVTKVDNPRLIASKLAAFSYDKFPKISVAITGTNGKSSTANFLMQIWNNTQKKSANLGTLGLSIENPYVSLTKLGEDIDIANLTTQDPITFCRIQNYLAQTEITHFVFEASSHGLDQKRLHGAKLSAAAWTNLACDHLDYHKTKSDYIASKLLLFSEILPYNKPAIVFGDDNQICEIVSKINKNLIKFGFSNKCDIKATNIKKNSKNITFDLDFFGKIYNDININLLGDFQVLNVLCALSCAVATGDQIENILQSVSKILPLNGRMEHIRTLDNGAKIFIDFAHTSQAFEKALYSFKDVCQGKLICVFGCGGDRDKSKRPEIGKFANDISDIAIITDDNPRFENPQKIRDEILKTCPKGIEIPNRSDAIVTAIKMASPQDFVVVIGKGHEEYQLYGNVKKSFSDKQTILSIL